MAVYYTTGLELLSTLEEHFSENASVSCEISGLGGQLDRFLTVYNMTLFYNVFDSLCRASKSKHRFRESN